MAVTTKAASQPTHAPWVSCTNHGAKGDGEADETAALKATDEAAGKAGCAVHVPTGTYNVDRDLAIESPILADGTLLPGKGATLTIGAPMLYTGRKSLGLERGGKVVLSQTGAQALDARYFGAFPGGGAEAGKATARAINEMFEVNRASALHQGDEHKATLHLAPGNYHIDEPIWAGFAADGDYRGWTLRADNAQLIAMDGLSDRTVFDLSGARRVKLYGLSITTDLKQPTAAPRYGILMSRPEGGLHVSLAYVETVRIYGAFKLACLNKYASELDYFVKCTFRNNYAHEPCWALINQGHDRYPATSEFATIITGTESNVDHYFDGCTFLSNWYKDPATGGCVHIADATRTHFRGCYFDGVHQPKTGIRVTHDQGHMQTVTVQDTHFHQPAWHAYLLLSGDIENIDVRGVGHSLGATGAVVQLTENTTISRLLLRSRPATKDTDGAAEHTESGPHSPATRFLLDAAAPNCNVYDAELHGVDHVRVSGGFTGSINVPSYAHVGLQQRNAQPAVVAARIRHTDTQDEIRVPKEHAS